MVDKNYCMSSYLAFRFIEDENKSFYEGLHQEYFQPIQNSERVLCKTADDIDHAIFDIMSKVEGKKGILLSGGMDSAILAAYMPGCDAYTFRFMGGEFQREELNRAEAYARKYNLILHYVDIDWNTVDRHLDPVLLQKKAPVHSIEPQIYQAALQAKADGIDVLLIGESSDLVFGGYDGLLAKDWTVKEFEDRYTFLRPEAVLKEPVSMSYLFERFRQPNDKIDFVRFLIDVFDIESSGSYFNAFKTAEMDYVDPYAHLLMAEPFDLKRIRAGESKYLIRELFRMKYPEIPVPEKVPMPRPVDAYFKDWTGPVRPEFLPNLDMSRFTGNQKWQMYCLERFLNLFEQRGVGK